MESKRIIQLMARAIVFVIVMAVIISWKKDAIPVGRITDYHQKAVTQFIVAGETRFAYRVLGDKPGIPLVMMSPLGSSMDDWDPAITNGLAQKYKVIIFDIQGAGASSGATPDDIPDMGKGAVSFIKALGYSKVNLIGFSMGSFICQQIVLTEPALVNKMILTGTGPKGSQGLPDLPKLLTALAGLTPKDTFLRFFFTPSVSSQRAGLSAYERIQKRQVDRDRPVSSESATAQVKAVLSWAQPNTDALKELQSVTQPVLIAQGQKDIPVPLINAVNMVQSLPNAQLIVYPDAGHAAFFQYPDEFVRSAFKFLEE